MKNIMVLAILWFGLIVESTLFQIQPISVIQPNLVLIGLVVAALTRGANAALILGVLIGFVQDVVFGSFLGLNAFTYGVTGYFAASVFAQFLQRNISITFLVVEVFTFIQQWFTFALTRMFGVTAFSWHAVMSQSLWQMLVNGVFLLVLYPLLIRLFRDKPKRRYKENQEAM